MAIQASLFLILAHSRLNTSPSSAQRGKPPEAVAYSSTNSPSKNHPASTKIIDENSDFLDIAYSKIFALCITILQ
jgi:hypothetical protein